MPLTKLGAGPSAGYTGVCVSDTFTDDDATLLPDHTPNTDAVGNGWQKGTGDFSIDTNEAALTGDQSITVNNALIDAGVAGFTMNCDVYVTAAVGNGVIFRASATDSNLEAYFYPTDGKIYFVKNDGGSRSVLASAATGATAETTYALKIVTTGTSIVISVDDVERINTTESFNVNETSVGPWTWDVYGDGRWDNLLVEA